MLARERHEIIMETLKTTHIIKITDIVKRFDVSNETARRDLEALQNQKLVKRIYGGAVLAAPPSPENQYVFWPIISQREKSAIGRACAAMINDGDTILLDTGTTMLEVARNLKHFNITVLTNSLPIINELASSNATVYVLGGQLNSDELCMCGNLTSDALMNFYVDKAFIGAGGVTFDGGVTDYNSMFTDYRRCIMEHSSKVILGADSNKFGTNAFARGCKLEQLDVIVSDIHLSKEYIDGIRERKIELIIVDPDSESPDVE